MLLWDDFASVGLPFVFSPHARTIDVQNSTCDAAIWGGVTSLFWYLRQINAVRKWPELVYLLYHCAVFCKVF